MISKKAPKRLCLQWVGHSEVGISVEMLQICGDQHREPSGSSGIDLASLGEFPTLFEILPLKSRMFLDSFWMRCQTVRWRTIAIRTFQRSSAPDFGPPISSVSFLVRKCVLSFIVFPTTCWSSPFSPKANSGRLRFRILHA